MYKYNVNYTDALKESVELFDNRVFKMRENNLFNTEYAKRESLKLHRKAKKDIDSLKYIINLNQ